MDKFREYNERYKEFMVINDYTLDDVARDLPLEKHYWGTVLIEHKRERDIILAKKRRLKKAIQNKILGSTVVQLTKSTLDKIDEQDEIVELDDKILELDRLIEYVEIIHKNITYSGQDIKNIISLKHFEDIS